MFLVEYTCMCVCVSSKVSFGSYGLIKVVMVCTSGSKFLEYVLLLSQRTYGIIDLC